MEKLWSPWRANYIQSFKDEKSDKSCVFCNSAESDPLDENNLVIVQQKHCYAMLNLYPYNSGHILFIPKRHFSDLTLITTEEFNEIMELSKTSIRVMDNFLKPHGYNFGANLGKAAGAGIDAHIHFHLVPRWNGDTNFMPVIGEVKIISQDLLETKKAFIAELKNLHH